MPEFLRTLPPWGLALGLIAVVVLAVLVIVLLFGTLARAFRRKEPDDGPSLADAADPLLRSRTAVGKFDSQFERMVEGTQLGISGESAIGWILLTGAVAAVAVFAIRLDEMESAAA